LVVLGLLASGLALASGAGGVAAGPDGGFYAWAAALLSVVVVGVVGTIYFKADRACRKAERSETRLDVLEPTIREIRTDVKALLRSVGRRRRSDS